MNEQEQQLRELAVYKYGFRDEDARYEFVVPKGLKQRGRGSHLALQRRT